MHVVLENQTWQAIRVLRSVKSKIVSGPQCGNLDYDDTHKLWCFLDGENCMRKQLHGFSVPWPQGTILPLHNLVGC